LGSTSNNGGGEDNGKEPTRTPILLVGGSACLEGYHFNTETMKCEADQVNGNYPGCPIGALYYVPDAVCDIRTTIQSPTELLHVQTFQLALPDCEASAPSSSQDSGGLACSPGQVLVCPDAGNPAACYCK